MGILEAAVEQPWLALGALFLIVLLIRSCVRWVFIGWNRWLRSRNIARHGWPTNPLMDADGDIIHPNDEADDGKA